MSKAKLTTKQQIQEDEYTYPYHWCKNRTTKSGRAYFGYLDLAVEVSNVIKTESVRILDVGCGDARFLKELRDKSYKDLHGIDYSEKAISFARLLLPEVMFSCADLTKGTSYDDNHFDVIFMIETLEHIIPNEIPSILKEIQRMLKPGGEFIVTVPSDAFPPSPKHYQHFSAQKLTETLDPFFDVIEVVGQDKMGFHPLKFYDRLIDNNTWSIKKLSKDYNLKTWAKNFDRCKNNEGRRIISLAVKR
jgi:SAM-dependent methyltransferase